MNDEDLPAIMGYSTKCATMADGALRVQIDVKPQDAQKAFKLFGTPGSAVAIARLSDQAAVEFDRPKLEHQKPKKGPYGDYAQALVKSGFFRTPKIWSGIGTDKEYLAWVRQQKSACSGEQDLDPDTGELSCEAAHVRHLEHGGGTALKPEFSAIPLTKMEHRTAHQKGDSVIGPREWWDKQRIKYVEKWAYETLKAKMGYDSYTDMPPHRLLEWAHQRELENLLPMAYHIIEDQDGEGAESQAESEA